MKNFLIDLLPNLQSFLYKSQCFLCKSPSIYSVCDSCLNHKYFNQLLLFNNENNISYYACSTYTGNIKKVIWKLKFENQKDLSKVLAKIMAFSWQNFETNQKEYTLIPIPIHKSKRKQRGFDQTEEISKHFAFLTNNKLSTKGLKRIRETRPQYKLNARQRAENLRDAFKVNSKRLQGKNILLIDDICTTGTTIKEAIKALNKAQIFNITVFTLCYVDLEKQSINIQ